LDSLAYLAITNSTPLAEQLNKEQDSLRQYIKTETALEVLVAKNLNNGYTASTDFETLDFQINGIWLDDFAGRDSFLLSNMGQVELIADLCPELYGPAVFKARNLFVQIKGFHKHEWELCNLENDNTSPRTNSPAAKKDIAPHVEVYPNPAFDALTIVAKSGVCSFRIFNILGKEVYNGTYSGSATTVDIGALQSGIYFLLLKGDAESVKFIVNR
jgi:Secretion system C-terminal sorting domain